MKHFSLHRRKVYRKISLTFIVRNGSNCSNLERSRFVSFWKRSRRNDRFFCLSGWVLNQGKGLPSCHIKSPVLGRMRYSRAFYIEWNPCSSNCNKTETYSIEITFPLIIFKQWFLSLLTHHPALIVLTLQRSANTVLLLCGSLPILFSRSSFQLS